MARSRNHGCRVKATTIKYYECVCIVALDIWDATASFQRRIILSPAAGMALIYFLTLSHKRHEFQENVIENEKLFFIFSKIFVRNFFLSRKNSARYYHECPRKCSRKVTAFFVGF